VLKEGGTVRLICSSSALFLSRRPLVEAVRKALVILGRCRDMTSIDHLQVVRHQRKIRQTVRRALEVSRPEGGCRFLLRIDDFPSAAARPEDFLRFHQVATEYGLPYLLAVTPFLDRGEGRSSLSGEELAILHKCSREGVQLALHGFSHRSRYSNYASELASLPAAALREEVERAEEYLGANGLRTVGFVAPFNAYDPFTFSVLAERYPLVCGGPESVLSLGYRAGPSFLKQSLYVPSYRYAYDMTGDSPSRLDQLTQEARGLVVPITLHWPNEVRTDFRPLRELCPKLAGATLPWGEYLTLAERIKSLPCLAGAVDRGDHPCAL
jgi:peptidoglycan/xylan/chitin deacetylase (PgdA/CDA1 family)